MPGRCQKIRRKKRQVCIGDLDKEVTLQNRDITSPLFGTPDFDETFTDIDTVWAGINTKSGKMFFDGVGTETLVTHEILIRYDAAVTTETWVEFDGRRFDILEVQDLEDRHAFLILMCTDRGLVTAEASKN